MASNTLVIPCTARLGSCPIGGYSTQIEGPPVYYQVDAVPGGFLRLYIDSIDFVVVYIHRRFLISQTITADLVTMFVSLANVIQTCLWPAH